MDFKEVWVDGQGIGGQFSVSNTGNVKSKLRLLKLYQNKSNGYIYVGLKYKKIRKTASVHRMVAMAFIPNPLNLPCVNHKNGNKANNHDWNLEWCTYSQNNQHNYDIGISLGKARGGATHKKLVLDTITGIYYDCIMDAAEAKGIKYGTLKSRLKSHNNNTNIIYT